MKNKKTIDTFTDLSSEQLKQINGGDWWYDIRKLIGNIRQQSKPGPPNLG